MMIHSFIRKFEKYVKNEETIWCCSIIEYSIVRTCYISETICCCSSNTHLLRIKARCLTNNSYHNPKSSRKTDASFIYDNSHTKLADGDTIEWIRSKWPTSTSTHRHILMGLCSFELGCYDSPLWSEEWFLGFFLFLFINFNRVTSKTTLQ